MKPRVQPGSVSQAQLSLRAGKMRSFGAGGARKELSCREALVAEFIACGKLKQFIRSDRKTEQSWKYKILGCTESCGWSVSLNVDFCSDLCSLEGSVERTFIII